ncbi:tetratricopeptide repeat-containing sulfotransferase family protein [Thalassotalea litorea]|uniref:tetratricopeptide repeat-containing sulfotransferase family protein n=1 Tax=Thalassotalea litorea TaxID=2020715 RepID=UPI003736E501
MTFPHITLDHQSSAESHHQREKQLDNIWQLINQRSAQAALDACHKFTEQYKDYDHGWYAYSFLLFQLKRAEHALQCIENAISIAPQIAHWRIHKAHILWLLNRITDGKEQLAQITSFPDSMDLLVELADVANKLADYSVAEACYLAMLSIETAPQSRAQLYFNLGSVQRYLGHIKSSEDSLDKALALAPLDTEAMLLRSSLRKQTADNNHLQQLQSTLKTKALNPLQTSQICYSLAKEFEDLKNYSESFKCLNIGAQRRRQSIRYDVKSDINALTAIRKTFDRQFINGITAPSTCPPETQRATPIFIFGLPRTGSTLVERILSNHSRVTSAGELNHFSWQLMQQISAQLQVKPKDKLQVIECARKLNLNPLGKAYLQSTEPYWQNTSHFIDKLPLNSLNAGLIKGAIPGAKMILVQRNPMDTCYAIYKHLFTQGYPFSYNLNELGAYYVAHHQLMQHWLNTLGKHIYTIRYEDLLANPQYQTKAMLAYCDLEFEEKCLQFDKNHQATTTASATQVRQGFYRDSIEKWRHFETELAPLQKYLEQAGINL